MDKQQTQQAQSHYGASDCLSFFYSVICNDSYHRYIIENATDEFKYNLKCIPFLINELQKDKDNINELNFIDFNIDEISSDEIFKNNDSKHVKYANKFNKYLNKYNQSINKKQILDEIFPKWYHMMDQLVTSLYKICNININFNRKNYHPFQLNDANSNIKTMEIINNESIKYIDLSKYNGISIIYFFLLKAIDDKWNTLIPFYLCKIGFSDNIFDRSKKFNNNKNYKYILVGVKLISNEMAEKRFHDKLKLNFPHLNVGLLYNNLEIKKNILKTNLDNQTEIYLFNDILFDYYLKIEDLEINKQIELKKLDLASEKEKTKQNELNLAIEQEKTKQIFEQEKTKQLSEREKTKQLNIQLEINNVGLDSDKTKFQNKFLEHILKLSNDMTALELKEYASIIRDISSTK
jgi:hypothetical protein